jgi:hypothetical protein
LGEGLLKHGNIKIRRVWVREDIKMMSPSLRGGTWILSQEKYQDKEVRLRWVRVKEDQDKEFSLNEDRVEEGIKSR